MKRKVSDLEKNDIVDSFLKGFKIKDIARKNNFSIPTISRQLKNILGEEKFDQIKKGNLDKNNFKNLSFKETSELIELNPNETKAPVTNLIKSKTPEEEGFFEIAPIDEEFNFEEQKEISSQSISEITLPERVYLIVDKSTELDPTLLNNYPEWSFLPEDDLQRNTIQIFSDQKIARKSCLGNNKVIKVPNSNVFKIASRFLLKKGISRIIFEDTLISIP